MASPRQQYLQLVLLACLMIVLGGVLVVGFADLPTQVLGATLAGGGLSLGVSTYIQWIASAEQTLVLRDLTLRMEGVRELPEDFLRLGWMAYATRLAGSDGEKQIDWRVGELDKIGKSGNATCMYTLKTKNADGNRVAYSCTFVGLSGRVAGIVAKGRDTERTAVLVFETSLSDSSVYFGPGYIVDWLGGNAFSLALVGTGTPPASVGAIAGNGLAAFAHWYAKTEWDVDGVFNSHRAS
jgi:hypothetical protein